MDNPLVVFSEQMADLVESAGAWTVAVHGRPHRSSSGIYWQSGVVVTAAHTVQGDGPVEVTLPGGERGKAEMVGREPRLDLAVLRLSDVSLPVPTFVAGGLRAGQLALAAGRADDAGMLAGFGAVSAVDRLVRLDFALPPGISGGAAIDASGRVIGMVTGGLSRWSAMVVPAQSVARALEQILVKGRVARGYLGIGIQPVPWKGSTRLIVLNVEPDSPAAAAGLLLGDVLVSAGGSALEEPSDLQAQLEAESIGKTLTLAVVRAGEPREVRVLVGERS